MQNSQQLTPMMRQYYQLKEKAGDAIMFFRMGDFYEIFDKDAEEVAPILEIVLTSREKGDKTKVPFCGIPHHSYKNYLNKLLRRGMKVAIAEQVEEASAAKGLVKRDITRIYTPGSIEDIESLEPDESHWIMSFCEDPKTEKIHVFLIDVSTGTARYCHQKTMEDVLKMVSKHRPKELVVRSFFSKKLESTLEQFFPHQKHTVSVLPEKYLQDVPLAKKLIESNDISVADSFEEYDYQVLAACFDYLETLGLSNKSICRATSLHASDRMELSSNVIRDLEVFESSHTKQVKGSLFDVVKRTLTPMGARQLRNSLLKPLLNKDKIRDRQTAVSWMADLNSEFTSQLRTTLKKTCDLERYAHRVRTRRIKPRELAHLGNSIQDLLELKNGFREIIKVSPRYVYNSFQVLDNIEDVAIYISRTLLSEASDFNDGFSVVKEGVSGKLDQCREMILQGQQKIDDYLDELKTKTGIHSLKVKRHKTYGLLLEVTKSNLGKVPDYFIRKQTMVNNERFITDELIVLDEAIVESQDQISSIELEIYHHLLDRLEEQSDHLMDFAHQVAKLDFWSSTAQLIKDSHFCKVEFADKKLKLESSRHPVVEYFMGEHHFIPNDIELSASQNLMLITGPNMAGKSTVMRQLAVAVLLSQSLGFVPAHSAIMPLFDNVFTRIGASDNIAGGQSTFMVEMSETAYILRNATENSLVILDEVGRGTSTQDGRALAFAILEFLSKNIKPYGLFATHYHGLIDKAKELQGVIFRQTQVEKQGDEGIRFTHKLVEGATSYSFGIEVAKLAGLPKELVTNAKNRIDAFDEVHSESSLKQSQEEPALWDNKIQGAASAKAKEDLRADEIISRLKMVRIHRTTPLQALNIINDLKSLLESGQQMGLPLDGLFSSNVTNKSV